MGMMLRTTREVFPQNYDYPFERYIKNRINANSKRRKQKEEREKKHQRELEALTLETGDVVASVRQEARE